MRRVMVGLALLAAPFLYSSASDYLSVKRKFESIENHSLKPGSRVSLTPRELNAYVQEEVPKVVPDGVREPKVELGNGAASASAMIDFAKVRRAQGKPPGWLMSKLLSGERPVKVNALIQSASGRATVDVQSVEVSGMTIDGAMLDYLIDHYLRAVYPTAVVGQPFELGHRIERLEIKPSNVAVVIGK